MKKKALVFFFILKTIPCTLGRCWKQWFSCQQIMLLLSDIHGGGAARAANPLQRGGSPFSLLTNSFDRSSSYGTLQGRAASSSVQRYSYWQVWISWRLHRRVWNWFLPNMAEVWVSNLLLLILYLSCCEHGQQIHSSKAMLSWLCVPIWTRLWLLTIKYIFRSAFHLSEKDWMHIYEPPATKSSQEESIEYIRCLGIHLLYT